MAIETLMRVLARFGYEVRFQEDTWTECLISNEVESWHGRGTAAEAAFSAAIRTACPSRIARQLLRSEIERALEAELSAGRAQASVMSGAPSWELPSSSAQPLDTARVDLAALMDEITGLLGLSIEAGIDDSARIPKEPSSCPAPSLLERASPVSVFHRGPGPKPRLHALPSARRDDPDLIRSPDDSLDALFVLHARIRESRMELGLSSAERQRATILAWICEARSHVEAFPDEARVKDGVAIISKTLGEIGKAFWPGSVTALQLQVKPADLGRHLLHGAASTWNKAADLSERALRLLEQNDERAGLDEGGWADAAAQLPMPKDGAARLQALRQAIEEVSGSLDRGAEPEPNTTAPKRPSITDYERWVRELRWLRRFPSDPEVWARLAGRLRWWSSRRELQLSDAAKELRANYVPNKSWASLIGCPEDELLLKTANDETLASPEVVILGSKLGATLAGKQAIVVSHRRDPEARERLEHLLPNVSWEWILTEPKKIDHVCEAVSERKRDFVLAAIGLQARRIDRLLAEACQQTQVPYVRANLGAPESCLRALARSFLEEHNAEPST